MGFGRNSVRNSSRVRRGARSLKKVICLDFDCMSLFRQAVRGYLVLGFETAPELLSKQWHASLTCVRPPLLQAVQSYSSFTCLLIQLRFLEAKKKRVLEPLTNTSDSSQRWFLEMRSGTNPAATTEVPRCRARPQQTEWLVAGYREGNLKQSRDATSATC